MLEHETWLPPGHCAALAGCSRRTVLHAIESGELPARRFNSKTIIIARDDLRAWIRRAEAAARKPARVQSA